MPDKLRIGVLSFPWSIPATAYGGIERMIDSLCRGLQQHGHEVFLWSATTSTCPVTRSALYAGIEDSDGWHSAPIELTHVLGGYEWLAEQNLDVIHDITFAGPLLGPGLTDVPIVTTNYLPFIPPETDLGHSWPDLSVIYRAMAERATVLAISQAQADDAVGHRPRTILLGIDPELVPVGSGSGDKDGAYAAFYARMSPEKGAKEAILAAKQAGVRLKIASRIVEPHEIRYFEQEVEPLLDGDGVEFIGELSLSEGYDFLGSAVALLHPIAWPDTFGTSTVESLATGTPVIALRGGAVGEVIEHGRTGAVCDSVTELAEALRNYPSYSRAACRERAEKKFSNDRVIADHVALYRSLISVPGDAEAG
ncbi:MAG: glycosyltransferase [Angustibacter sp.]